MWIISATCKELQKVVEFNVSCLKCQIAGAHHPLKSILNSKKRRNLINAYLKQQCQSHSQLLWSQKLCDIPMMFCHPENKQTKNLLIKCDKI